MNGIRAIGLEVANTEATQTNRRKEKPLMSDSKLNLLSFSGKTRILHLSWFAFFLTFVVWFSHAPLMA